MGLDMYLYAEKYVSNWNHSKAEERDAAQSIAKAVGIEPFFGNSLTVSLQAAYWRKANCIHRWFVENIQGGKDECQKENASRAKLQELLTLCKVCLENPTEGFFFGSISYGDAYAEDLKLTVAQLEPLLNDPKWQGFEFYYRSSW